MLLFAVILPASILLSGCLSSLPNKLANPTDNAPVSSFYQQSQRPFQADMDVPDYLDGSFRYDEAVVPNGIPGTKRPGTPGYYWCELLNPSMAVLKYDYIMQLCLYSVGAEAHYKRGFMLDILGYDDLAAIEYTQAIDINPQNDRYYNNRGNLYLLRGNYSRAVGDFTRAIEINPNRAEPYYNRGRALAKMGNRDAANLDYERAVDLGICKTYPSLKICR